MGRLEQLHHRADDVEHEDDQRLVPALQLQREQSRLDRDGGDDEKVVAGQRRVGGPEQMGAHQQGQHQTAEQAGPGLFQAEQQEFVAVPASAAPRAEPTRPEPRRRP
jgi:uncharacterized protein involved in type VI secretion and phage assembly